MATRMADAAGAGAVPEQPNTLNQSMGPDAANMMMQADDDMRVVLLSRLESLTPEELQTLDTMIDGNSARVMLKLLPELQQVIEMIAAQVGEAGPGQGRGALSSM